MFRLNSKVLLMLIISISLICLICIPALASGEKYYSQDGKFKIFFNGTPEKQTIYNQDSEIGVMTWIVYRVQTDDYLGIVLYYDLPENSVSNSDIDFLKRIDSGMVDNSYSIISEETITISGNRGIEIISGDDNSYTRRILVMARHRIYICSAITSKELITSPKVEDFINSFEIVSE